MKQSKSDRVLGNKEIRIAAENVVAEETVFVEVKGTTALSITEVLFRYFTNGEYNKATECAKTGNKYEVHLVIGVGAEIRHYVIPGETILKECRQEVSWVLPIRKAHGRFQEI